MKTLILSLILFAAVNSCNNKTQHLYVADHLVDCQGEGNQKCMLVKGKIVDNWSTLYDNIEGFDYEEGYEYLLKVKVKKVKNPPADASSIKFILVEVYEKKKTQEKVTLINNWKVISMRGVEELTENPTIKFDDQEKKISGYAGCNNFFGTFDPESKQMDFSKMGVTRKMCPDMTIENNFLNNLRDISHYEIEGNQLFFYDKNNELLLTCEKM
jgi:heat shock protein HslJ